jgi:hypothetical protein
VYAHAALLVGEAHCPFVGAGGEASGAGFFGVDLRAGGAHHRAAEQGFEHLGLGRQVGGRRPALAKAWSGSVARKQGKQAALHASLPLASAGTIQKNTRLVANLALQDVEQGVGVGQGDDELNPAAGGAAAHVLGRADESDPLALAFNLLG